MACEPNRARLLCMLSLTFGFFVVEVVVSRITASLAMLSDSFHMLSDVMALVVALVAVRFAARTQSTNKNTFGWVRAEVMGALVNAVFLSALCFSVVLEAISRFTEPHEIDNPPVLIGVGIAGLAINLLGLCLFREHAHGHSHGKTKKPDKKGGSASEETNNLVAGHVTNSPNGLKAHRSGSADVSAVQLSSELDHDHDLEGDHDDVPASQLNMRGVFLHVLGDALGSVIVVVNALIFTFVWVPCEPGTVCMNPCIASEHCADHQNLNHTGLGLIEAENTKNSTVLMSGPCWVLYLDPTLCIIMVCILLYTTYPLLKESALILLQTVPKQIDVSLLSTRLRQVEGVLAVHELHIWQLAGSRIIATAHIKCRDPASYMGVAKRLKSFFHNEGIHATTIQPEFVMVSSESYASLCELSCRTQCAAKLCCQNGKGPENKNTALESKNDTESAMSSTLEVINESLESEASVVSIKLAEKEVGVTKEAESSL